MDKLGQYIENKNQYLSKEIKEKYNNWCKLEITESKFRFKKLSYKRKINGSNKKRLCKWETNSEDKSVSIINIF